MTTVKCQSCRRPIKDMFFYKDSAGPICPVCFPRPELPPTAEEALALILKVAKGNTNYDGWAEVVEAERVLRAAIGIGEGE